MGAKWAALAALLVLAAPALAVQNESFDDDNYLGGFAAYISGGNLWNASSNATISSSVTQTTFVRSSNRMGGNYSLRTNVWVNSSNNSGSGNAQLSIMDLNWNGVTATNWANTAMKASILLFDTSAIYIIIMDTTGGHLFWNGAAWQTVSTTAATYSYSNQWVTLSVERNATDYNMSVLRANGSIIVSAFRAVGAMQDSTTPDWAVMGDRDTDWFGRGEYDFFSIESNLTSSNLPYFNNPSPANNSAHPNLTATLQANVFSTNTTNPTFTVRFYTTNNSSDGANKSNYTLFQTNTSVPKGSTVRARFANLSFGQSYCWYLNATTDNAPAAETNETNHFCFTTPLGLQVFYEALPTTIISVQITGVTILINGTPYTRDTVGGVLNLSNFTGWERDTRITIPDSANYYTRQILFPNGFNPEGRIYALDKATSAASSTFTVVDFTGGDWTASPSRPIKIFFDRFLDTAVRKVTGAFLSTNNAFSTILHLGACYTVWIESTTQTMTIGEHCAAVGGSFDFNIGLVVYPNITATPGSWIATNATATADRALNGTITRAYVVATYNDSRNATSYVNISIARLDGSIVFVSNMTTNNSNVSFFYEFNLSNESVSNRKYFARFNYSSSGTLGNRSHPFDFGLTGIRPGFREDLGLTEAYAAIIGLFLVGFVALSFTFVNADVGIIATTATAGLLTAFGFLSIPLGGIVLMGTIGFLAAWRLRRVRQEGGI